MNKLLKRFRRWMYERNLVIMDRRARKFYSKEYNRYMDSRIPSGYKGTTWFPSYALGLFISYYPGYAKHRDTLKHIFESMYNLDKCNMDQHSINVYKAAEARRNERASKTNHVHEHKPAADKR